MGEEKNVDGIVMEEEVTRKKTKKKSKRKKEQTKEVQNENDTVSSSGTAKKDTASKKKKEKKLKKEKKKKKKEDAQEKQLSSKIDTALEEKEVENDNTDDIDMKQSNDKEDEYHNNNDASNYTDESEHNKKEEDQTKSMNEENNNDVYDANHDDNEYGDEYDSRKIFLSRIPSTFNEESITRILQKSFGENCIEQVALSLKREDDDGEASNNNEVTRKNKKESREETSTHRGFAFVTMSSVEKRNEAIEKGTIRGRAKESSKRKHTMYIRPIVRKEDDIIGDDDCVDENQVELNICFLWSKYRCPYGDDCKFKHVGEGGCIEKNVAKDAASRMKKQKCFSFRTKGKCKLGEKCPYSHDIEVKKCILINGNEKKKEAKDKDCISWKSKGKCRRIDKCPYRHDESVRQAFLAKKEKKQNEKKKRGRSDNPQPLSVRVFGLNYDTKEEDIRKFFEHCGNIREITFPKYEDSGRSKGYCGVLFTSPKATEKATAMDGSSLHGRWLSIQGGKMYLRQWEEREQERTKQMDKEVVLGEYGQRVKKRKKHGFRDE